MKTKKNALEWAVFGVSTAIIATIVALLVRGAVSSGEKNRPDLRVTTHAAAPTSGGYLVPVVVSNSGDTTAEQARIEIALMSDGEEVEKGELTIAFVPRKSQREGWVVFTRDPRCCEVVARTIAYEKP